AYFRAARAWGVKSVGKRMLRTEGRELLAGPLFKVPHHDPRRPGDGDAAAHAAVAVWRSPGSRGRGVRRGRADPAADGLGAAGVKTDLDRALRPWSTREQGQEPPSSPRGNYELVELVVRVDNSGDPSDL